MADKKGLSREQIALLCLFVLPLLLVAFLYLFSRPVYEGIPYEYTLSESGDTLYQSWPESLNLYTLQGEAVTPADLLGNICLVDFFSTDEPARLVRKVQHGHLQRIYDNVQWERGPALKLISICTDDSLEGAIAYAAEQGNAASHWMMLHGSQEAIIALGKSLGFPEFADITPKVFPFTAHTVALVDKAGKVRKRYIGTDLKEERNMQNDLNALWHFEYPEELKLRAK